MRVCTAGAILLLTWFPAPASSQTVSDAGNKIATLALHAMFDDDQSAIAKCQEARNVAVGFGRDPILDGLVERCFAMIDSKFRRQRSACDHYRRALQHLESAPKGHRLSEALDNALYQTRNQLKEAC